MPVSKSPLPITVGPAANPLRYESGNFRRIAYAGYTLRTTLKVVDPRAELGLWQLLQLPHGGDMLIRTHTRTNPVVLFGKIPNRDLRVSDGLVQYRMRASGAHKIAVRAAALTGRVGYLYRPSATTWALVIT